MKKRILSLILAVTMILAIIPSVAAFELNSTYDNVLIDENFNTSSDAQISKGDGADGTDSLKVTSSAKIMEVGANSLNDIFMSFDVRFDNEAGNFTFTNSKSKIGPSFSYNAGVLRTQTGSTSYQTCANGIQIGKWYNLEFEGKFVVAGANVVLKVYEYTDGQKTLISTIDSLQLRQFYGGSGNGNCEFINVGAGISVDNIKAIKLGADRLEIKATSSEVKAGNILPLTYETFRQDVSFSKPNVTWSVYNEDNTALLNDANISIDSAGVLNAGIDAATQTITVRATADSGLFGSYPVKVSAVDLSDVKFDKIELASEGGRTYVSTKEPLNLIPTATKEGSIVELSNEDLIWYVCEPNNVRLLGNKDITVINGQLSVADTVIAQNIVVRVADIEDKVRASFAVTVKSSDAKLPGEDGDQEVLLASNACESIVQNATLNSDSIDGSSYYTTSAQVDIANMGSNMSSYMLMEMDIRFDKQYAGFTPMRNDNGKLSTCVRSYVKDGATYLAVLVSGSTYTTYTQIDPTKWYHIQLLIKPKVKASIILHEYDENGNRTNKQVFEDVSRRNDEAIEHITIEANTSVDNIRILNVNPNEISLSVEQDTMFAGKSVKASFSAKRDGVDMGALDYTSVKWEVYDENNQYPLENDKIFVNVTEDGNFLTVDPTVSAQTVYLRIMTIDGKLWDAAPIEIKGSDIFTVKGIGINEAGTKIVALDVQKDFYYDGSIVFVIAVYDENGALSAISFRDGLYGVSLNTGELNTVTVDVDLPTEFNQETDTIKVFTWTSLR